MLGNIVSGVFTPVLAKHLEELFSPFSQKEPFWTFATFFALCEQSAETMSLDCSELISYSGKPTFLRKALILGSSCRRPNSG